MKLEPNMYVKTKWGYICKIININDFREPSMRYGIEANYLRDVMFIGDDDISKASHNIIDLIEVGDYVNGWRVNRVEKEEDGTLLTIGTITSFVSRNETEPYLTQDYKESDKMCKIKSIVTKEQFSSMEFRLGNDK